MITRKLGSFLRVYSLGLVAVVLGCTLRWGLDLPVFGILLIVLGIVALSKAFRSFENVVELSQQQEWRARQSDKNRYNVLQEVHHN